MDPGGGCEGDIGVFVDGCIDNVVGARTAKMYKLEIRHELRRARQG